MTGERILTWDFVLASLATLLAGVSFTLFLHLPGYLASLGALETQIGIIFATSSVASLVARPPLGRMIDQLGRWPVIVASQALNILFVSLYLTVSTIGPWMYVIRAGHGIAIAGLLTVLFTVGADVIPVERRTEGLALLGLAGLLPIAVGGLIGDVAIESEGYDGLFLAAATFAGASAVVSAFFSGSVKAADSNIRPSGFWQLIKDRTLAPTWALLGIFSVALVAYTTFIRTFIDESGFGTVGVFFATFAGTAALVRLGYGRVAQRRTKGGVLYPALICMALGLGVLAVASSGVHVLIAGFLCGVGHGYAYPILMATIVTAVSPRDRGSAMGIFTAHFDLGIVIGAPLLGGLIELASYSVMFGIVGGALLAATVVYVVWERRVRSISAT